jgi:preprotein translocase subunit SecG
MNLITPLTVFSFVNSFLTIVLVLNQNDSTKDSKTVQTSTSPSNPLENFTWVCLFIQFLLLLLKLKITET